MSRSRRTVDNTAGLDVWTIVDNWAEEAVDPVSLRARWSARAVPARGVDHLVDVLDDPDAARAALRAAGLRTRPIRPAHRALGRTGDVAYPDHEPLIEALTAAGIDHRIVTAARRYVWKGALTGKTACEISTASGRGGTIVEAWYEPVWTDTFRLRADGGADERRRPRRVVQARAAVNRLLGDLGVEPLGTA